MQNVFILEAYMKNWTTSNMTKNRKWSKSILCQPCSAIITAEKCWSANKLSLFFIKSCCNVSAKFKNFLSKGDKMKISDRKISTLNCNLRKCFWNFIAGISRNLALLLKTKVPQKRLFISSHIIDKKILIIVIPCRDLPQYMLTKSKTDRSKNRKWFDSFSVNF